MDLKQLSVAVGELEEEKVSELLNEFVATNPEMEDAQKVLVACQEGMGIVGEKFESSEYFVADLILAGEILLTALNILKPVIGESSSVKKGKIVLGTVRGDLHDIGKNIFKNMADAAGFEIYDLGIDQPAENFIKKVQEVNPEIVGLSGVLTLAVDSMKDIVDGLKEAGLRDGRRIIIGGNPVTEETCKFVGADAFTTNAAEGVKICKGWVS